MSWQEFQNQIWPIKDRLFRMAFRVVNDHAEAEDVVQEVLVKVWQQDTSLALVRNIEAWCMRLTRNLALDKLKAGYSRYTVGIAPEHTALQVDVQTPENQLISKDVIGQIEQLMSRLPEAHRMVMHLRDVEELSYQEIADTLDMTMAQVKTNLFRARQAIREQLINQDYHA